METFERRCKINFQIELHNFCQFTCGYCPNKDMQRKREFMSDEVWHKILYDYIVPYRHENEFCPPTFIGHKDSEPLIDRKLPTRLRELAAAAPDMKIDIYSNGVLLPNWAARGEDFIEFLGTLPVQVRYMMSYHPRNHDDSVNNYDKTISYMRTVLRDMKPPNVEFITVSHKSKWVTDDMQNQWAQTWAGLPITVHSNCSINPWTGRMEEQATCHYNGCPYSDFGHWFFGCTGNVIACCLDLEEEIVLGNVLDGTPPAVMFARTAEFYDQQRRLLEARAIHPRGVCRNCYGQQRDNLIQVGVGT